MPFIRDDFMLTSKTGYRLFYEIAKDLPIIDYHCHLPVREIAQDHRFRNATELFLGGDHYKWRQMRTFGVDEAYITGDAADYAKFEKWAEVLPLLIGNPLLHWNQLELCRYFGIQEMLTPANCRAVYEKVNTCLTREEFSARNLILRSGVEVICTTDDPLDDLSYHASLSSFPVKVLPTFRPDACTEIAKEGFADYIRKTGARDFAGVLAFLREKMDAFEKVGCRLADHGMDYVPYREGDAAAVFEKRMNGGEITPEERDIYRTAVLRYCAGEYARRGFAMQIHMGVMRNNNTRLFETYGPDAGCDSVADGEKSFSLSRFLDSLDREDSLPKTVLYNLNPCDNFVLATMVGNFQRAPFRGKVQFGAGWWFNDQRDGMEKQMRDLAALGGLAAFVGMLTDSRSFVSYPRHEYFRRIFCNLIGEWVDRGEYPDNAEYLEKIVRGVCYQNAKEYFAF